MTATAPEPPLVRRLLFWVVVVLLVAGFAVDLSNVTGTIAMPEAGGVGWLFVMLQTAISLVVIALADPLRRQRVVLAVLAFLWGGFAAADFVGYANDSLGSFLTKAGLESLGAALSAPLNEEVFKLLGVLALLSLTLPRRLTVMDGFALGFVVGAGFDVLENIYYALGAAADVEGGAAEQAAAALASSVDRLTQGFALHALWTSLAGAGLAFALSRTTGSGAVRRWLVAVALLVAAMLLHALWDLPPFTADGLASALFVDVLYVVTVAATAAAWWWALRSELALLRTDALRFGLPATASVAALWRPSSGRLARRAEREERDRELSEWARTRAEPAGFPGGGERY
ncbi:PrsW family glutamic-type intramembrane protease [Herbiconiux sp. KACC 21604]|uniref:PrsW family glutamic-type intramembrane protease n=1 Tax=unclassified Herbiconiux TaxID=2618217 RepID=UPI001491A0CD|nr:PrsW family glutamic-type intramembrane protease [Herbiconiux sp. SALV-R1]QJU52333.1 PrsW family intramembrane metalloprotease [Herbiconiux sp. SALV-R1]WPO87189.1 PrsW family glutamic-type intramembrane protease [Herbiconiux sp. KACC 21604]